MGRTIRNPFYWLLLIASFALLFTVLVNVAGWYHWIGKTQSIPNESPDRLPAWMRWIDRHSMTLIAGEVVAIIALAGLTIGLDRVFDSDKRHREIALGDGALPDSALSRSQTKDKS